METLNIAISEDEKRSFGIVTNNLTFSELVVLIGQELLKQTHDETVALAEQYGLDKMTMEEITNEVKAVRHVAKSNS